ncbi:hypothetical protein BDV95DRAFT_572293 [Massariosphaeria phaeospora]|uniref:Aerobic respiration control sensor protein arcB n=1 Tax=Massariosphaeria phaeospora TaxID=100035 RepID=A0A7C8MKJ4_9PLEO|nr:hypothetical protein BDV95DRAFT_572293 [Massariosphaeria phaeospora]
MNEGRDHAPREQRHGEAIGSSLPKPTSASARAELGSVRLLDALDVDDRPTFAIDASSPPAQHAALDVIYCNRALSAAWGLLGKITRATPAALSEDTLEAHTGFRDWLFGAQDGRNVETRRSTYTFEGHIWCGTAVGQNRIVSGLHIWTQTDPSPSLSNVDLREHKEPKTCPHVDRIPEVPPETFAKIKQPRDSLDASSYQGPYDYTLELPPGSMSEHIAYFRSIDWAHTPLGPMHHWPARLRCMVNLILNDSCPAVLFWGDQVTMIYNASYVDLISVLHPCMGQSARMAAPDCWPHFQTWIDHINATGQTLVEHDMPLSLTRHGFLEEAFFSFQFIPVLGGNGQIAGYYQPLVETTRNNVLERRVSMLVEIGSQTPKARDLDNYWSLVIDALATHDEVAPFALLYAAEPQDGLGIHSVSSPSSVDDLKYCVLKGAIGVQTGHPIAPSVINSKDGNNAFVPYLMKAAESRTPMLVFLEELGLPALTLSGIEWKGYGDPCRCILICPLQPTTSDQVLGFLILGINPRRPFDGNYQRFIEVMIRILSTSLASVVLLDEEMRQKEIAIGQAACIQEQLLADLKLKENKFQRFAERCDIAIFMTDPSGRYTYRNQRWFDIFKVASELDDMFSVWKVISPSGDSPMCETGFVEVAAQKTPICFELQTIIPWTPPSMFAAESEGQPEEHYTWILCSAYPELGPNNELVEILGNVTDISRQKWAESLWKNRTDNALESKKHLEHFIDTTSHEMRNPLSAIMQCADGILSTYCVTNGNYEECQLPSPSNYGKLLEETLDAAQTIAQCAQHMKRIVDDVLTISKLDSGLLVITPIDAQPESVANHAVKMFQAEARAAGVDMIFTVEQSYRDLDVNWVSLDPTRMLQILINLITNAVKFTRLEARRHITVSIAASNTEPRSVPGGIQFIAEKLVNEDPHLRDDWKKGSTLYIQFLVQDTGRGLSEAEKSTLFTRFSQASPRTHINYGGSGLGLFISRRLTELQGGAIGLASAYKQGSTFSFYIRTRRVTAIRIDPREIGRSLNPSKARPLLRRQSAIHSDVPAEARGLPAVPNSEELKRANSMLDTLHVLVVEDNLVNQKVLAKQLRNLGCIVSVANHGIEALEFLKTTKFWNHNQALTSGYSPLYHISSTEPLAFPDAIEPHHTDLNIILMDWEMPVMNGLTAVAKIRELERAKVLTGYIPVIGVTANVRQQQIKTAMEAGMDDVMGKPFKVTDLLDRMKTVVAMTSNIERLPEGVRENEE